MGGEKWAACLPIPTSFRSDHFSLPTQKRCYSLRPMPIDPERFFASDYRAGAPLGGRSPADHHLVAAELTRRAATTSLMSLAAPVPAPPKRGQPIQPSETSYAQGWLIEGASRILFISGQVPTDGSGRAPAGFDAQARLAWANLRSQLHRAGMDYSNLAKITIYLSHRRYRAANTQIRAEILGPVTPAITVVISGIFDETWLLEIEAIACG